MNNCSYPLNAGRVRLEFYCLRMTGLLFFSCVVLLEGQFHCTEQGVITAELSVLNLGKIKYQYLVRGSAVLSGSILWPFNAILIPFTRYSLVTIVPLEKYYTSNCPKMHGSSHIFLKPDLICSCTKMSTLIRDLKHKFCLKINNNNKKPLTCSVQKNISLDIIWM